ncbi:hypothetical protein I7I48_05832 [Histoplasma ohiense]|nr:hypothetical protein I7I48_05832 [Histoplasma ohiense (nom. inval.)]
MALPLRTHRSCTIALIHSSPQVDSAWLVWWMDGWMDGWNVIYSAEAQEEVSWLVSKWRGEAFGGEKGHPIKRSQI